jgi:hypothetical protein
MHTVIITSMAMTWGVENNINGPSGHSGEKYLLIYTHLHKA